MGELTLALEKHDSEFGLIAHMENRIDELAACLVHSDPDFKWVNKANLYKLKNEVLPIFRQAYSNKISTLTEELDYLRKANAK
eukprot:UN14359